MLDLKDSYYYIVNATSRNYVTLTSPDCGISITVDAPVQPAPDLFKWRIEGLSNGNYSFRNAVHSNSVVSVESTAVSKSPVKAHVDRHPFQWTIKGTEVETEFMIFLTRDDLCWSLPNGELQIEVELAESANVTNARWTFESALPPAGFGTPSHGPELSDGYYFIVNAEYGNYITLTSANRWIPITADAPPHHPVPDNVKWRIERLSNGNYVFRNAVYSDSVVCIEHGNVEEQSSVKARPTRNVFQWSIEPSRVPSQYTILLTRDDLCWCLPDGELQTSVELSRNPNVPRARWRLEPSPDPVSPPQHSTTTFGAYDAEDSTIPSSIEDIWQYAVLTGPALLRNLGAFVASANPSIAEHLCRLGTSLLPEQRSPAKPAGFVQTVWFFLAYLFHQWLVPAYVAQRGKEPVPAIATPHGDKEQSTGITELEEEHTPPVAGVVAVRNRAGHYMRVIRHSNGLAFDGTIRDDFVLFAVRRVGGKVALISLKNGRHVSMCHGIHDVMCNGEGPAHGLSLSVECIEKGWMSFGISGYREQHGRMQFLSSKPGNTKALHNDSLGVLAREDDSCRFRIENVNYEGLGRMEGIVAILNAVGQYMKVDGDQALHFEPSSDEDIRFIVQVRGRKVRLIGNNGQHVRLHKARGVVYANCSGNGEGADFGVRMLGGASIVLTLGEADGDKNEMRFLTCRQSKVGGHGTLEVTEHDSDQDSVFTFVNLS